MKKFRFLEHTADIFIEGNGKTLAEAFQNTALGLQTLIAEDLKKIKPKIEKKIKIQSEDEQALVVDFLGQFLVFHDAENLVFSKIKVESIKESKGKLILKAAAKGEHYDPKRHGHGTVAKAITYHEMEIKKKKGIYSIKVLIDI